MLCRRPRGRSCPRGLSPPPYSFPRGHLGWVHLLFSPSWAAPPRLHMTPVALPPPGLVPGEPKGARNQGDSGSNSHGCLANGDNLGPPPFLPQPPPTARWHQPMGHGDAQPSSCAVGGRLAVSPPTRLRAGTGDPCASAKPDPITCELAPAVKESGCPSPGLERGSYDSHSFWGQIAKIYVSSICCNQKPRWEQGVKLAPLPAWCFLDRKLLEIPEETPGDGEITGPQNGLGWTGPL